MEVADRVWVARHAWFDLNVTAVGGENGLVVVDTHASGAAARDLVEGIRNLGAGSVTAVVNTHEHFDHTFGNATFLATYGAIPVHAHETAAANTVPAGQRAKRAYRDEADDPRRDEVLDTEILPAGTTFSSAAVIDLGDRQLELVHPGRGHTGGDLVARVPDADVVLAGDLVEEGAPAESVPAFGDDCYPLEWPATLDVVLGLTTPASVVVPGHGSLVDRTFVSHQRDQVTAVAETIRELAGQGVAVADMLAAATWPFPPDRLTDAVRRGHAQLRPGERRLRLL